MDTVLDVIDAASLRERFRQAGVFDVVAQRGFCDPEIEVATRGLALPHVNLWATKGGRRHLLLEACLSEMTIQPSFFAARGSALDSAVDMAVVYWVREQDPTRSFRKDRPPLPLQRHPGLGALRQAFRVIAGMAVDAGKDGVACMPKFFHDAVIFYRSRLFLFLDPAEQGRFEALLRDLSALPLRDVSLALFNDGVTDAQGLPVSWQPGYQVYPLSPRLTGYFNSPVYEAAVAQRAAACAFACDQRLRSPPLTHIETGNVGS